MKNFWILPSLICVCHLAACQQPPSAKSQKAQPTQADRQVGGSCECCEAINDGTPETLNWETQISPPGEPGEPLEVTGTIFKKDGKTPVEGVLLYVYHTDNQGLYADGPKNSECANRHGHLRGWTKTGTDGRYRLRTIRPASYPNSNAVQHIHPIIKEPGKSPYWIDEFVFDDDPNLQQNELSERPERGGTGLMKMAKNADGTWLGRRDIILGKNVPGY